MIYRVAVLDDYQNVALKMADWSVCADRTEVTVFNEALGDQNDIVAALADFDIVCLMRERTPFPEALIRRLPRLKLIVTSGPRNATINVSAAAANGITVSGTDSLAHATAELVFAHLLEFYRNVGHENARLKAGAAWQSTLGRDLSRKTLGLLGLGRLGQQVARIADAFGMNVVAWSQNLTPEQCAGTQASYVTKDELFTLSDVVSVHLQLSSRTRGLVGRNELMMMKSDSLLINTSRGPIVDEAALVDSLRRGLIAGAAIDVFDEEPLAVDHPFRSMERAQITPHLGYVTEDTYRTFYGQTVEDICAFIDGAPKRLLQPDHH